MLVSVLGDYYQVRVEDDVIGLQRAQPSGRSPRTPDVPVRRDSSNHDERGGSDHIDAEIWAFAGLDPTVVARYSLATGSMR